MGSQEQGGQNECNMGIKVTGNINLRITFTNRMGVGECGKQVVLDYKRKHRSREKI